MSTPKIDTSVPEIPPEVERRMKGRIALTPHAAESMGSDHYRSETDSSEKSIDPKAEARELRARQQQIDALNELTKTPPGYEPCAGLTAAQTNEIMARNYDGQPKMDGFLGDLTPEFVVWLFQNHARDAHVRYYTRLMPSLGVWMARQHPNFEYKGTVAPVVAVDFNQKPTEGRETPTLTGLLAEKARLKAEIAELKQAKLEDAELKQLRAELADLRKATKPEKPATRRPRK